MTQDGQRNNNGQFIKGNSGWWKGKHHTEETKRKMSKNNAHFWLGKHLSEKHKRNMSRAHIEHRIDEETKRKIGLSLMGKKNPMYGKEVSAETREKISGAKSHLWQGGISFEPYGLKFNNQLKEQIRKRDSYRCQQCFRHQDELYTKERIKYKLSIHHIDYNKKNNDQINLISLCRNCHSQTNFDREDWTNYFQNKT